MLKIIGIKRAASNIIYDRTNMIICAGVVILVLSWSCIAASQNLSRHSITHFLPWCFYYIAIVLGLFPIFHGLALLSLRMAGAVDHMLTPHGRAAYERWAGHALRIPRQVVFGCIIAIGTCIALRMVDGVAGPDTSVLVLLPSYVIVAITGFFCGIAGYWAIAIAWFAQVITKRGHIKLHDLIPARTPGIEELSQITVTGFVGAAIYSVLLLFPVVYWTYHFGSMDVTRADHLKVLVVKWILILLCAVGSLAIGVVPQIHISLAVQRIRHATMLSLLGRLDVVSEGEHKGRLQDLFAMVANSPGSPLGNGNIIQITVGVVVALLPLAVIVMLH
jgi:hypothetical protein